MGAENDLEKTRAEAATMAQSLADAGINLNLAPVVDVAVNPTQPDYRCARTQFFRRP